jgi:hypothetical protein
MKRLVLLGALLLASATAEGRNIATGWPQEVRNWVQANVQSPADPFVVVPGTDPNGWSFSIEPYGWGPGVYGDIDIGRLPTSKVDTGTIDILRKLNWGAFLRGEVRRGRWGLLGDGFYAKFSSSIATSGNSYTGARAELEQSMVSAALAYRVVSAKDFFADIYAGARYNYLGASLSGTLANPLSGLPTYVGRSRSWLDPIIGLRGQYNFTEWLFAAAQGDVGGFGAGSQLTWNTQATLGVNFTRNIALEAGYRYMFIDYNKDKFLYRVNMPGVFAGLIFKF